jgi:hydroxymethylpyrimidine pyrophosphatase-like HAD family hydrolase
MPAPGSDRLGRLLIHTPMSPEVARDVVEWTRARGLDPHLNRLERFIVRADDPRADDYRVFMGSTPELAEDLVASIRRPITKILAEGEPPLPTETAPLARERFAGLAEVMVSHPRFIEFTAPGVSKGRAIRWLARRLRIPLGAVLAIGDQWNDIEMLAEVGHGTAMPTAPTEVLAVARYIAPPLAEEGVARMIEALVLARPKAARTAAARLAEEAAATRALLKVGTAAAIPA